MWNEQCQLCRCLNPEQDHRGHDSTEEIQVIKHEGFRRDLSPVTPPPSVSVFVCAQDSRCRLLLCSLLCEGSVHLEPRGGTTRGENSYITSVRQKTTVLSRHSSM